MAEYDFTILQPAEFETFSRDILQAREKLFIESFADGRDNGIDCRFAYGQNRQCIIQCKRYAKWSDLKTTLSREVEKVKKLNPNRYIITTSVDLTAHNKEKIREMFQDYIKADADILGKSDLNNLVSTYPEIEQKHYKLWMSSTKVLQNIINSDIIGWSNMSLDQIREDVSKYVENDSFAKAVNIIKQNHCVVISGEPGIGKTTLARMLVIYFLEKEGYNNYTYISDNLSEALKIENKGSKQVVFFDDFLGRNFLENKGASFYRHLDLFTKDAARRNDRILIITTREYLYQEAKIRYDGGVLSEIEKNKYILKMGVYDEYIKSQIIYNHFAAAELPIKYAKQIRINRNYLRLVQHPNFNPRLVESIVKDRVWDKCTIGNFFAKLVDFFDNPTAVWDEAFNNLQNEARYSLYVLATMPTPVFYEDWKSAYFFFQEKTGVNNGLHINEDGWNKMVRTLEQCFIKTNQSGTSCIVDFANPSVLDFIINRLKENTITCLQLIENAYFCEQLLRLFCEETDKNIKTKICVSSCNCNILRNSFVNTIINKRGCKLKNYGEWTKNEFSLVEVFISFIRLYPRFNIELDYFIEKNLNEDVFIEENDIIKSLSLLRRIDISKCSFDIEDVMTTIQWNVVNSSEVWEFIETANAIGLRDLIDLDLVNEIIKNEVENVGSDYDCEELINTILAIESELDSSWDGTSFLEDLYQIQEEYKEDSDEDSYDEMEFHNDKDKQYEKMDELFDCLCSN